MTIAYSGSEITFPDNSVQATAPKVGMVNRIINGAMVIDQRNAGASVTPANGIYTLDRWLFYISQASKFTVQQNAGAVTPPVGFSKYLGITSSAATSVGAGDYFFSTQRIEGFNTADLNWGTANAATVTFSFRVYSSLTGTFGGALQNANQTRSYPFTYSVPVANTWTTISITVAGDTSGTWVGATNGVGLVVCFGLGMGSTYSGTAGAWASAEYYSATGATSVVGTSGATFYITGVDLRKGSTGAYSNGQNDFDYRPYGTELGLCQRYFEIGGVYNNGYANGVNGIGATIPLKATKRATPTGTFSDSGSVNCTSPNVVAETPNFAYVTATSAGSVGFTRFYGTYTISAEL